MAQGFQPVYFDEMGVNLWTRQRRGRAHRSRRARILRSGVPGCGITVHLAVTSIYGVIAFKVYCAKGARVHLIQLILYLYIVVYQRCHEQSSFPRVHKRGCWGTITTSPRYQLPNYLRQPAGKFCGDSQQRNQQQQLQIHLSTPLFPHAQWDGGVFFFAETRNSEKASETA